MKKIYESPMTALIYVEYQKMIATSSFELNGDSENEVETTEILSRRGNSLWDDEEDY